MIGNKGESLDDFHMDIGYQSWIHNSEALQLYVGINIFSKEHWIYICIHG